MKEKTNRKLSVKSNTCNRSRYPYPRNRQGGALLLGLIVTMVIFGALGGAMVYFISSSAMDSVFGNFAQRAYYASESGMRYAAATYRKTGDHETGKTNFWALRDKTLSFPNNGQAALTITDSMVGVTADVQTTVSSGITQIALGGNLTINDSSKYDKFPEKSGFFRIGADTNYYRYKTRTGGTLSGITGAGSWPKFVTGGTTTITAPPGQYSITSVGYYPSIGGVGLFRRTVEYGWILSGIPGGPTQLPPAPPPVDLATLAGRDPQLTGSMEFALANPGGDQALVVSKDQGGGIDAEAYVFVPPGTPNPFWVNWGASGGYSSYDLQVKIATGTLNGTTLALETPPTTYANGLTFRSIALSGQRQDFLGVSLVRNTQLASNTTVTPPAVFTEWRTYTPYLKDVYVRYNGDYYQCREAHTSRNNFSRDSEKWVGLSNADTPMIVLWRRDSNHANGDGTWLAYKILDEKSFIVDASGHTIDWSTLLVRVVEAASVKLGVASAPLINIGDTIAGATGTAKVFRKINETSANGGNVVLLLNNIGGTFTRPTNIAGYNTDATWGYRSRDNYIWVFYTDQNTVTPVRSSTNTTPMETPGENSIRLGQKRSTTACAASTNDCPINWPITDVQSWTAADDRFSLVNWNSNVNTTLLSEYPASYTIPSSATATIRIMGSGKEAGAIIRTDLYTRPGPYAVSADFPGEIGLVSLGGVNDAFFDDLAYRLTGGASSGLSYIPYVQQ